MYINSIPAERIKNNNPHEQKYNDAKLDEDLQFINSKPLFLIQSKLKILQTTCLENYKK